MLNRPTRRVAQLLVLTGLVVGIPACGGDDDSDVADHDPPADGALFVAVDTAWKEHPRRLPSGGVEVSLRNDGSIAHSLVFEDTEFRLLASAGEEVTGEVALDPGEVYFFCDIPGHEAAGMLGLLTVDEPTGDAPDDGAGRSG